MNNRINIIESKDNSKVKLINSLKNKKNRDKTGLMIVEGLRAVEQLAEHNGGIELVAVSDGDYIQNQRYKSIIEKYPNISIIVKSSIFEQIADTVNTQGIIALVKIPKYQIKDLFNKKECKIIIMDMVQDPGNAGTIIRTADAAGFDAILYTKGTVDLFSPKVNRSAMGSNLYMPVLRVNYEELEALKKNGFTIYSTALDGYSKLYNSFEYSSKTIIILGNEANGVSREMLDYSDERVYIPLFGRAESLNVAIAGGILMYQVQSKRMPHTTL